MTNHKNSTTSVSDRPVAVKTRNWGYLENWKSTAPSAITIDTSI